MKLCELAAALAGTVRVLVPGGEPERVVTTDVYCCDLLSIAMGRAPADGVWVTVMANTNAIAVAVLTDLSVLVIAEGMAVDENTLNKAKEQGVALWQSELPVYPLAKKIDGILQNGA